MPQQNMELEKITANVEMEDLKTVDESESIFSTNKDRIPNFRESMVEKDTTRNGCKRFNTINYTEIFFSKKIEISSYKSKRINCFI